MFLSSAKNSVTDSSLMYIYIQVTCIILSVTQLLVCLGVCKKKIHILSFVSIARDIYIYLSVGVLKLRIYLSVGVLKLRCVRTHVHVQLTTKSGQVNEGTFVFTLRSCLSFFRFRIKKHTFFVLFFFLSLSLRPLARKLSLASSSIVPVDSDIYIYIYIYIYI